MGEQTSSCTSCALDQNVRFIKKTSSRLNTSDDDEIVGVSHCIGTIVLLETRLESILATTVGKRFASG
jgi:hypothetical protein